MLPESSAKLLGGQDAHMIRSLRKFHSIALGSYSASFIAK